MADNEKLGQAIDRVESLASGLDMPMPAEFHLQQLKKLLPEIVEELKAGFVQTTGENPWE
jgi:exonuclease V gamma subunit